MSAPRLDEAWLKEHVWPRFSRVLQRGEIYLANHSLGRPPGRMAEDVRAAIDAWYRDMDGAWDLWMQGREGFRNLTARLVNAPSADCIVPKTSARPVKNTPSSAEEAAKRSHRRLLVRSQTISLEVAMSHSSNTAELLQLLGREGAAAPGETGQARQTVLVVEDDPVDGERVEELRPRVRGAGIRPSVSVRPSASEPAWPSAPARLLASDTTPLRW